MTKIVERLDLGEYATFKPNKDLPRHRWFYFKEGFSRHLVEYMLRRFRIGGGDTVLDPFMGVGTTPLTCREVGVDTVGVEVSPLFKMVADAKIADYDVDRLWEISSEIMSRRGRPDLSGQHPLLLKAFPRHNLYDILLYREAIEEIPEARYRNFFYTALLTAANKSGYAFKDGSRVRILPKKHVPPFKEMFRRTVKMMISDVEKLPLKDVEYHLYQGDARRLTMLGEEEIDAVITSPPYLNKIEYTTLYEVEYLLVYGDTRVNPIRSYIGLTFSREDVLDLPREYEDLPPGARAYFTDLRQAVEEMYRVLRRGGRAAIVIGQGIYPDRVIPSDRILAEMARGIGFREAEIWIVNKRIATRSRTVKIGVAEESIVVLRK